MLLAIDVGNTNTGNDVIQGNIVNKVLEVQRQSSIDRRPFEKLERFYADVFDDDDDSRASACVDVWIAVGVTFECLSTMMRTAAVFSVAFEMVSFFFFFIFLMLLNLL